MLDQRAVKWGAPEKGTPATIRYAFLKEPVVRRQAFNCGAMAPFPARLPRSDLGFEDIAREFRLAFDDWQRVAGIRFVEVAESGTADLLLGVQSHGRGIAFTDVVRDSGSAAPMSKIDAAAICMNPGVVWKVGFDRNLKSYDVRYVALHEIGHVIGLDHVGVRVPAVMSFEYTETVSGLQPADIAGARALYGAPEPGETKVAELPATAVVQTAAPDAPGSAAPPAPVTAVR